MGIEKGGDPFTGSKFRTSLGRNIMPPALLMDVILCYPPFKGYVLRLIYEDIKTLMAEEPFDLAVRLVRGYGLLVCLCRISIT